MDLETAGCKVPSHLLGPKVCNLTIIRPSKAGLGPANISSHIGPLATRVPRPKTTESLNTWVWIVQVHKLAILVELHELAIGYSHSYSDTVSLTQHKSFLEISFKTATNVSMSHGKMSRITLNL